MNPGVWVSIAVSCFWLCCGVLIYILWRDRVRRKREKAEREHPVNFSNPNATSVKDLEKQTRMNMSIF